MQFDYSTENIEAAQRSEYWTEVVCRHLIPSKGWMSNDTHMQGRYRGHSLGALTIASSSAPHRVWNRTEEHVRTLPDDDIIAIQIASGSAAMQQANREVLLQAGDIALYDAGRPFRHEFFGGDAYALRIPRKLLLSRLPNAESLTNIKIGDRTGMPLIIGGMLREASERLSSANPATQGRFASAILDTISSALQIQFEESDSRVSRGEDILYRKALAFIDANLDNSSLSATDIADALHVSRRTLSRAFARQDSTLMQCLWNRRLEMSHQLLQEGKVKQISQAAYQCGFGDLSHFCRSFKKMYGSSPGQVLPTGN